MDVKVWDVASRALQFHFSGHATLVTGLDWHPDGKRLASCGFDKTIKLWDTDSGQLLLTLPARGQFPRQIAWSPDGRRLAGGTFSHITVWDAGAEYRLLK